MYGKMALCLFESFFDKSYLFFLLWIDEIALRMAVLALRVGFCQVKFLQC